MAKKFQFSYPYASYMDVSLMRENKTRKELIAEYSKMQAPGTRDHHHESHTLSSTRRYSKHIFPQCLWVFQEWERGM